MVLPILFPRAFLISMQPLHFFRELPEFYLLDSDLKEGGWKEAEKK